MEIWKRSKKFDDYEVSTEGRVRNANTGRVLKTTISKKGYEEVSVRKDNKAHTQRVRTLVAETFIEGDHEGMNIHNKDDDRLNSRVDNLEYRTQSEILKHAVSRGTAKPPQTRSTKVRVVETGEIFNSIHECASALNLSLTGICKCVNGAAYTCGGLHFEKID